MIRLDKYLADHNLGTRSELKNSIKKGLVQVNSIVVKSPDIKIDPEVDQVSFQGKLVTYEEFSFYVFNKPAGVITAASNDKEATVMDYMKECPVRDLFPVGRLDKDTHGLLLITNHGELAHRMLAPKSHVDKVYYVGLSKPVTESDRQKLEDGVSIGEGEITAPAKCEILQDDRFMGCAKLTIHEGKFHQVKRMFEAVSNEVVFLKRLSFGPLVLEDSLEEGTYRKCKETEVKELLALLKK